MRNGVRCRAMRTRSTGGGRRRRAPVTNERAAPGYAYLALVRRGRRRAVAAGERQEIGGNPSGRGLARIGHFGLGVGHAGGEGPNSTARAAARLGGSGARPAGASFAALGCRFGGRGYGATRGAGLRTTAS